MKPEEVKKLIIRSLDADSSPQEMTNQLENAGVSYDFSKGFADKVTTKIFSASLSVNREVEFVMSMSYVFKRIAFTGIAAIVILMISIFVMEGSFSLNSILGMGSNYDESIICMLTGK
jgi:type IV secretory pathway VirB6-like protein